MLASLISSFWDWVQSDASRAFLANTSLFLLVGGLSILSLILTLVLLRSVFPSEPERDPRIESAQLRNQLRPPRLRPTAVPAGAHDEENGRKTGIRLQSRSLDGLLDLAIARGLGEPRVIRHRPDYTYLRFLTCRGCAAEGPTPPSPVTRMRGCTFERGFLEGGFRTLYGRIPMVRETVCRRRGDPTCEFEVRH